MPNFFNDEYENLASKGRYGDTMLAHITPEEAALLKARGGAGTINPRTGLREFFDLTRPSYFLDPEPLPVLAQAFDPNAFNNLSDKLNTITVPARSMGGMGSMSPAYEKVSDNYLPYADRSPASGMGGGRQIQGYTIPVDQTFQGKPLEAKYDPKGNFQYMTLAGGDALTPDPNQPDILSSPRFNKTGGIIDYGIFDRSKQDSGSFGSMIREIGTELGPMILAALGAQFGAAGASTGTGLTLGGGGLGLTGTIGTGLDLAATTGGGLGLTAGSAGAGAIGAGLGTTLAAINTGIGAGGGTTGLTLGDAGLTTGGASSGTGLTATPGTGLDLASTVGGGTGIQAGIGSGLDLAATTGGGLGINAGSIGADLIGSGLGTALEAINTGVGSGLGTGFDYSLSQGGGDPGIRADLDPTRVFQNADLTLGPVDYGLNPVNTGGLGLQFPTMPALTTMGGAQGLTTKAFGELGQVGAKGFTPFNAVPDLGDPKSFINNPDVTGLPRLDSDIFKPTDLKTPTDLKEAIKNIGEVLTALDPTAKKSTAAGGLGSLGNFGSLQFGQSYLPGASYSAPESSMVRLREQAIIPALAAVLQQRGMNINQPSFAKGGRVHRPEFITGKTGHYAQGRGTGQSDDIPAILHDGDYVVDADTVAAFGDGSSKAGAGALEQFRRSMPEHHSGGGQPIRAQIADGEYVLPAAFVTSLGRGSNKNGAKMLDAMREEIRAHKRSAPDTKIPPKAKKPMQYMREAMKG